MKKIVSEYTLDLTISDDDDDDEKPVDQVTAPSGSSNYTSTATPALKPSIPTSSTTTPSRQAPPMQTPLCAQNLLAQIQTTESDEVRKQRLICRKNILDARDRWCDAFEYARRDPTNPTKKATVDTLLNLYKVAQSVYLNLSHPRSLITSSKSEQKRNKKFRAAEIANPTSSSSSSSAPVDGNPVKPNEDEEGEDDDYEDVNTNTFAKYMDEKIPGCKRHPDPLIESSCLAGVIPPTLTYIPHKNMQKLMTAGLLSSPQMETVLYACQKHEEAYLPLERPVRRGFFLGGKKDIAI